MYSVIELFIKKLGEVQENERLEEVVNDVQGIILDVAKPCKKRPTDGKANRHTVYCVLNGMMVSVLNNVNCT